MGNMMSHFDTVLLSMDEILIVPNQQLSAMLGAHCYWEVMGSRLDGTHTQKKRCEMSNGWLMYIPCFSTTMTWPCLKYMAHFPSPTFSRAYDNQYVLYCCNISQGGQGWCFSPDDSGINPIQGTICGWCWPNAAVIATESPAVFTSPLRRNMLSRLLSRPARRAVALPARVSLAKGVRNVSSTQLLGWNDSGFRTFVEDTDLFPYKFECKYKLAI